MSGQPTNYESHDLRKPLQLAADALRDLIDAGQMAKDCLDRDIPLGDPVHPVSRRLTWPLSTALLAEKEARHALAASVVQGKSFHDCLNCGDNRFCTKPECNDAPTEQKGPASEELQFLTNDLLYWVERAVGKGNANSDIEEAYERYEQWLKDRAARASGGKP